MILFPLAAGEELGFCFGFVSEVVFSIEGAACYNVWQFERIEMQMCLFIKFYTGSYSFLVEHH